MRIADKAFVNLFISILLLSCQCIPWCQYNDKFEYLQRDNFIYEYYDFMVLNTTEIEIAVVETNNSRIILNVLKEVHQKLFSGRYHTQKRREI